MITRVLLVIMDDKVLNQIQDALESRHFEVFPAKSGMEALQLLATLGADQNIDVIISNLNMPEMDGFALFTALAKDLFLSIAPFILITDEDNQDERFTANLLGIDGYIVRPFKLDTLVALITGKVIRHKKNRLLQSMLSDQTLFTPVIADDITLQADTVKSYFILFKWDEDFGPVMVQSSPPHKEAKIDVQKVGSQLFQAAYAIYGQDSQGEAQSVLLDVTNIHMKAYVHFFSVSTENVRGGFRLHMVAILARRVNIIDLPALNQIFTEIASKLNQKDGYIKLSDYRQQVDAIVP